ncbi:IS3 family transposase [Flavobacterium sp. ANB]|uniref:IS3 family transposase n=1 Tax=Flavobacterium sp. ANB TaxID=2783790 RepID=UPI00188B9BA6|nr:IS3 family transposase [Flavobacterium sp. ANB]MBF4519433.1 IS3 family transposase [Flavobacterium sp. ANB]
MNGIRKKYDRFFKEKAILLSYESNCLAKVEEELNIYPGALSKWRQKYKTFGREHFLRLAPKLKFAGHKKTQELKNKVKRSDLRFEILKNAGHYIYEGKTAIYYFMADNEKIYSIRIMAEVLNVDRTAYRKWKNEYFTETQIRKLVMQKEITSIFFAFKERYGSERIAVELQNLGYQISGRTVRKYMSELGLSRIVKKN